MKTQVLINMIEDFHFLRMADIQLMTESVRLRLRALFS